MLWSIMEAIDFPAGVVITSGAARSGLIFTETDAGYSSMTTIHAAHNPIRMTRQFDLYHRRVGLQ